MKSFSFYLNRRGLITLLMAMLFALPAFSQKMAVQGTVIDENGEPIIGASVVDSKTKAGTATDFDGNFVLNVDKNAVLQVTYVGYKTQNVNVDGRNKLTVKLQTNSVVLNEVVAIGYGTVKKEDATGAISTLKPDEIEAGLATSAQDLLVGAAPGVVVTSNGGQPEGGATIRIRGGASLNATNDPLIVIDGVPMDTKGTLGSSNPLSFVSPENIENMTILKDASATAIYGSRASNGVIIITTKKGQKGRPQINFTANAYVNTPRNYVNMMTGDEFRSFINNYYGAESAQAQALGTYNTNWQKEILRTSVSHDYSLGIGGTVGCLPYRVSLAYTGNNGIIKTSKMDRVTLGVNLTPKFFDDLLAVNLNLKGAYVANRFYDGSALGNSIGFNPTLPVKNPDGNAFNGWTTYVNTSVAGPNDPGASINTLKALNPVALIQDYDSRSKVWQSIGNLQLDLAMPFLRDLHANLNLGYDYSKSDVTNITGANSPMAWKGGYTIKNSDGSTSIIHDGAETTKFEWQEKYNLLLDFYLNYKKNVKSINSNFDITGGYSWQKFHRIGHDYSYATSGEYAGEKYQGVATNYSGSQNQLVSFFGRVNYSLLDRYLLTVTVREDGTSRFSDEHRWGTFPSLALAWRLLEEPWMKGAKSVMNDFKIRAGWGITGQQDLGDDFFPYLPVYMIGKDQYRYPDGKGGWITVIKANGYNADLKWEETTTWNAGIDMAFLNNRVTTSIDFYKRNTEDLLNWVTVDAGSNLTNAMNANIGSLENIGVEFAITARPIVKKNFTWTTSYNVAWNKNKITKLLKGDDKNYFVTTGDAISAGTGGTVLAHKVGYPASSFYVYEQVYDENGKAIEGMFVDRNGDGVINADDKYMYHSKDPKVTMNWTNTFNFKNWDFGFALRASIGNYVFNDVQVANSSISSTASLPVSNLMADTQLFKEINLTQGTSDYFVQNASFVRCDNITLGYTWPTLLNNNLRLRLYGAVQNPFVITKYKGLDPEVGGGVDKNIYPRPVTFSLGLVAQF